VTEQRITTGQHVINHEGRTIVDKGAQAGFHIFRSSPIQVTRRLVSSHPGLVVALFVYLAVAFSFFFIVPIFEAPDEWTHTGHVKYIAEGNGLPVMWPGRGIWGGQQPPLYYVIGAILAQPFELAAFDGYSEQTRNPHASLGYALDPGNKNNYLHDPAENFPYQGLALTVHILRLYSMMFGLVTIVFSYLVAYELVANIWGQGSGNDTLDPLHPRLYALNTPQHVHLFATVVALFMAGQPMFAFITASVANEPANMAFSAISLWLAQRYILYGPTRQLWRAVGLGLVLGLVSLSKMTGLSVGLVAVIAILITAISTRKRSGAAWLLWRDGLIIGALFLGVGGWWYWRNYQLYGDFFQRGLYKIYFNADPQPLTLSEFLYTLSTGEVSFWATFGWLNIVGPDWIYSFYRIMSRVGLIGVGLAAALQLIQRIGWRLKAGEWRMGKVGKKEKREASREDEAGKTLTVEQDEGRTTHNVIYFQPALVLHIIFPIALAFSLTRLVAIEGGIQGRQLLPALSSIAILIIWGWWILSGPRLRRPILGLLLALVLGLALWLPHSVVAQAYIPRPFIAKAELPADLDRVDLTFNGEMKLIGAKIGIDKVRPGQRALVTVYWQALKPMTTNYSVFVHLIGRNYQNVGQLNTYPGLGLRPTTTLEPGQILKDTYPVLANGGSEAPTRLLVNVGLFDIKEAGRPGIPAIGPEGQEVAPTVGRLKLVPVNWPPLEALPPVAGFGDDIQLQDYRLDNCATSEDVCLITFKWLAQAQPAADYTVFIQLWQGGKQVAGFDGPPLGEDYPTSMWEADEVILDPHRLDLSGRAPGEYRVLAGLYNFATGERLPASVEGAPLPDNAVELGIIQIK
jgi:hypothetical protein